MLRNCRLSSGGEMKKIPILDMKLCDYRNDFCTPWKSTFWKANGFSCSWPMTLSRVAPNLPIMKFGRTSTFAEPQKRFGRTEPNLLWNHSNFRNLIKWRNVIDPYVYCFNHLDLLALCNDDVFQFLFKKLTIGLFTHGFLFSLRFKEIYTKILSQLD